MSQIRVNDIRDSAGSNSSTPAQIASGRAKAWVNWNGTGTVAIRASYNVSSITDNGTGDYTVNFSSSLTDGNYACVGMAHANGGGFMDMRGNTLGPDLKSSSQCRVRTQASNGTVYDITNPTFAAFR